MAVTFKQFLIEDSDLEKLKRNKKPLTDEERQLCLDRDAVWNRQDADTDKTKKIPAVWKSVDGNGKTTYVTNTHRAYNTASTIKGAIRRYHDFIKGTA